MPKRSWALFLDLDGTLLDLAETPGGVLRPVGLVEDLSVAADKLDGALAIVTGRSIAVLDELLRPLKFPAAGQHGAELRLSPADAAFRLPTAPIGAALRTTVLQAASGFPGVDVEDKGQTLAFHYRAAPAAGEALRRRLMGILAESDSGLALGHGKMVMEIRDPRYGKGSAVEAFMGELGFAGRLPIFIGDDETDRDGFAAAERLGGVALRVGGEQAAFAGPADVRGWLAELPDRFDQEDWP
jgi:trehalose 6-phosphate phosphatase